MRRTKTSGFMAIACAAVIPLALGACDGLRSCTGKSLSGVYDVSVSEDGRFIDEASGRGQIQTEKNTFSGWFIPTGNGREMLAFEGTFSDNVAQVSKDEVWKCRDGNWRNIDSQSLHEEFEWSIDGYTLRVKPKSSKKGDNIVITGTKRSGEKPFTGNLRDLPCNKKD